MDQPITRVADTQKRGPGRPPASAPQHEPQDAIIAATYRHVPPLVCPLCGRADQPLVQRWVKDEAYCQCKLCAGTFTYSPAKVRPT